MIQRLKSHYKNHSVKIGKFAVVGAVNTIIDFFMFFVFFNLIGLPYTIAHVCAFFIAWANSFIFNAFWTFKNLKREQLFRQMVSFLVVGLIGLAFSTFTIWILGGVFQAWFAGHVLGVYGAKVMAMFVSFVWNYYGSSVFVFK